MQDQWELFMKAPEGQIDPKYREIIANAKTNEERIAVLDTLDKCSNIEISAFVKRLIHVMYSIYGSAKYPKPMSDEEFEKWKM